MTNSGGADNSRAVHPLVDQFHAHLRAKGRVPHEDHNSPHVARALSLSIVLCSDSRYIDSI